MYLPRHQAQLVPGISTASRDCGPRATSVAIDRSTRGAKRPTVGQLRNRGGMGDDWTNASEWERAVESYDTKAELRGRWDRITAVRIEGGDWDQVDEYVKSNEAVILAIDYGKLRRAAPRKTGSETFNGFHSVTIVGRKPGKVSLWRDYDSLNDGRYRGCPKGPVWMPRAILKDATLEVGRKVLGRPAIWAVLVNKAERLGKGVEILEPTEPEPEEFLSLGSVLADMYEFRDKLDDPKEVDQAQTIIDDYEQLLGISGDEETVPETGVTVE